MPKKMKAGIIGSGAISFTYLKNLTSTFSLIEVIGCSDIIKERSKRRAECFGIKQMTNEQILEDPEIEIVINLTYPLSHYEVTKAAINAGKHVFSEKMLSTNYPSALELYRLAKDNNVRIGQAPDTFLGGGLQTARKILDSGLIGEPFFAQAMVIRCNRLNGEERQDTLPFVFSEGGSIPYDMGGYYIHALVNMFGPICRVAGFARPFKTQITQHNPRHPDYHIPIALQANTLLSCVMEFQNGCVSNFTACSESHVREIPRLEVYGTEGTIILPDPNTFCGPVYILRNRDNTRMEFPLTHGYGEKKPDPGAEFDIEERSWINSYRGIGAIDMAWAIRNGRPHRCSAELGLHAIEAIYGVEQSSKNDNVYFMNSKPDRPAALPSGYIFGTSAEECFDN